MFFDGALVWLDAEYVGLCVDTGGSYAQIVRSAKQLLGTQLCDGGGGICDDAECENGLTILATA